MSVPASTRVFRGSRVVSVHPPLGPTVTQTRGSPKRADHNPSTRLQRVRCKDVDSGTCGEGPQFDVFWIRKTPFFCGFGRVLLGEDENSFLFRWFSTGP